MVETYNEYKLRNYEKSQILESRIINLTQQINSELSKLQRGESLLYKLSQMVAKNDNDQIRNSKIRELEAVKAEFHVRNIINNFLIEKDISDANAEIVNSKAYLINEPEFRALLTLINIIVKRRAKERSLKSEENEKNHIKTI